MGYGAYNFDLGVADGNPQLAPLTDAAKLYPKVAAAGLKYWRIMCPWNYVAKTQAPGTTIAGTPPTTTGRDWSTVDRCINDILLLSGCDILMIIGQGHPSWGGFQFLWFTFGATASTSVDYGNFVTEVVNRYKPGGVGIRTDGIYAANALKGVTHWEIWNEQNSQLWGASVDPTDYTAHLKAAYTAIKAIQPGSASTVIYGGLQHVQRESAWYLGYGSINLDEMTFFSRCLDLGAGAYFDAVGEHIYTQTDTVAPPVGMPGTTIGPAPATTTDNWQQLLAIRALMVSHGLSAKPIWITELGFATNSSTEAEQLTYLQQVLTNLSALSYIATVIYFNARDNAPCNDSHGNVIHDDATQADPNNAYGLMYYDFTPKAVMAWLLSVVPHHFTLSVTPALSFSQIAGPRMSGFAVAVTPSIGMAAAERYRAAFALSVTPSVAMAAAERYHAAFGLAVTPSVSATGGTPGTAAFGLAFSPAMAMLAAEKYARAFALTVAPSIAMVGAEKYARAFGLAVTPSIAVAGVDRQVGAFGLTVTPSFGMSAVASQVPPVFDAVGGGGNVGNGFATSLTATWAHTPVSVVNGEVTVDFVTRFGGQTYASQTFTVTYGGVAMTRISSVALGSDCALETWGLVGQASGTKTVSVTVGNGANTGRGIVGNSVSYTGVNQTTPWTLPATTGASSGSTNALSVSSAATRRVHNAMGTISGGAQSAYNQTQRYNQTCTDGFCDVLIGDALGAGTTNFSSNNTGSAPVTAQVGVELLPV